MLSYTEENYLKTLFKLSLDSDLGEVGTNDLANNLEVKPGSANEMLKKLKEKEFVDYKKYGKIRLTHTGKKIAVDMIRKHRLWETFLYEKLNFSWDEVHELAEELEHIHSKKLIDRLDAFLDFPEVDPHGDPIPNEKGEFKLTYKKTIVDAEIGKTYEMVAVKDNSSSFLKYVVQIGLGLHNQLKVKEILAYDGMFVLEINGLEKIVSPKFAENIYIK